MTKKYNLVNSFDLIKELDSILMDKGKPKFNVLSYDTETNGLNLHKSTIVGFSISVSRSQGYYIPLLVWQPNKDSLKNRKVKSVEYQSYMDGQLFCPWTNEKFDEFITPKEFDCKNRLPWVSALLSRWLNNVNLYTWNGPFDRNQTLINFGVDIRDNIIMDGSLLVHILDENEPTALKKSIERFRDELGINPYTHAAMEKNELDKSIVLNGGTPGMVWRADLEPQMKYACADTNFTHGICEEAMVKFVKEFGIEMVDWVTSKEVMPVCREVVCDMKYRGVYIDVPHFEKLSKQNTDKMDELEDKIISTLNHNKLLDGFNIGKSIDDEISHQALVKKIIELEGLSIPKVTNKKGETKESIAKTVIKKEYQNNPHWVWGYILGEDELKYSNEKIKNIKYEMYKEKVGKRYHFNINSTKHLRWLFCEKLNHSQEDLPQTDSATKENPIASMTAEVLKDHFLKDYPWVKDLLLWRKLEKLQSSYVLPALSLNIDGWLYMDMKQNGTTSGRFSCSGGFNLQTLPRADDELEALNECSKCGALAYDKDGNLTGNIQWNEHIEAVSDRICNKCDHTEHDIVKPSSVKKGFIAPPGYKIVAADYSSLEPRCFAVMSGEEAIKDVYRKGLDLYSQVYCEIFDENKEYSADPNAPNYLKKVANHKRKWVKPIVLGIPYGSGDAQVASMIGATKTIIDEETGEEKVIPDVKEGNRVKTLYLTKFSKLNSYMDEQEFKAVTLGYVETVVGRRRHLPYAKKINDVLIKYGIDFKDLKESSSNKLRSESVKYVSRRGVQVSLTKEMLEEIKNSLNLDKQNYEEKGYWAYIRNLLKADLNNAKNNPIQGLAGSTTNVGMLETNRIYKKNGIDGWVCLQVHDELIAYVREDQSSVGAELMKTVMENNWVTKLLDIPMVAEPIVANNLKEAK